MKFTTVISTLAIGALAQLVGAAPMAKVARDVWDPKVTYPTATTIWESGQTYTVTWDTSDQPAEITHPITHISLAFDNVESPVVLADGFDIRDGQVQVTVPLVYTDTDYSIVLWGDSGNISPQFTIIGTHP